MSMDIANTYQAHFLKNRWCLLAVVFMARAGVGFQFIAVAALMSDIQLGLHLNYAEIGTLLGSFMLAGVLLSLPSGMIINIFGERLMLLFGLAALIASGVLMSQSGGFPSALAARLCGGLGAVFITVTGAKVLTGRFIGKEITTAMSFLGVAWPVGIAFGIVTLPLMGASLEWRSCMLITVLPSIAAAVLVVFVDLGTGSAAEPEATRKTTDIWSITRREFVLMLMAGLCWSLMSSGGYVVFSSYAPTYLITEGMNPGAASFAVGILSWLIIVTIPLGGYLVDRFGHGDTVFWAGCLVSAAAIFMVPIGGPVILLIVISSALGFTVGAVMALPSHALQEPSRATGMGLFYTVYYAGTAGFPALGGYLYEVSGRTDAAIWLSSTCLMLAPLMLHLFRRTE